MKVLIKNTCNNNDNNTIRGNNRIQNPEAFDNHDHHGQTHGIYCNSMRLADRPDRREPTEWQGRPQQESALACNRGAATTMQRTPSATHLSLVPQAKKKNTRHGQNKVKQ